MNKRILRRGGDCSVAHTGLTTRARTRHSVMALALSTALVGLGGMSMATPALAQQSAAAAHEYAIPAGSLREALDALGQQSDIAIVFSPDLVDGKRTAGVTGRFTPAQALRRLLEGSGLELDVIDATTYVLKHSAEVAPKQPLGAVGKEKEGDDAKDLPTILVRRPFTDANVDIVRTENDPQPYYIFTGEEIASANVVNLEDFFKQRLTMNAVADTQSQAAGLAPVSNINLRGLGLDQTLILVNGRRTAGSESIGTIRQFDLNAFSPSMIDRVEVLPSSASAVYGGSAVGGVINVILKRDFTGGEFYVNYDTPLDKNAPILSVSGGYGWSFNEGRTNIALSANWRDSDSLLYQDRLGLVERGLSRVLERSPGLLYSAGWPFYIGSTPNVASADGTPLVFKNNGPLGGVSLNSPFTYIPQGTSPTTPLAVLQGGLLSNADQQNTAMPRTASSRSTGLLRPFGGSDEAWSLGGAVRHRVTERLELIGEVFYNRNRRTLASTLPGDGFVPAGAPTNPFQQDVWVTWPGTLDRNDVQYVESLRSVVGFVLDLPYDWRMQGDYTWNRNEFYQNQGRFDIASAGTAWYTALEDGSVNLFVDTLAYQPDLTPYALAGNDYTLASSSTMRDMSLRVSGPTWTLPAGQINLTLGLGNREEKQPWGYIDQRGYGLTTYFPQVQRVTSAYGEVLVPLIAPTNDVIGVHQLDFQLASRLESFSVSTGTSSRRTFPPDYTVDPNEVLLKEKINYSANNTTLGLRYKPIDSLTVRASRATAFLPPGFSQLIPGVVNPFLNLSVVDPKRGGESYTLTGSFAFGGNPDLKPMDAKTWNVGVIFEPTFLAGLRIGLEWFQIERSNLVFSPDMTLMIANEDLYPGRVARAAPEPSDPYGVGRITFIDASAMNAAHVSTEGFDISLSYRKATEKYGNFSFDLLSTVIDSFTRVTAVGTPEQEIAGQVFNQGPLKLRANATLGWTRGPWSLSWTAIYYGPYEQFNDPLYLAAQGGSTIPHQIYHNLLVDYRFTDSGASGLRGALSDVSISLGIRNVLNDMPPFDAYAGLQFWGYGGIYSSPFGDPRLRTVQLSISKRFQ